MSEHAPITYEAAVLLTKAVEAQCAATAKANERVATLEQELAEARAKLAAVHRAVIIAEKMNDEQTEVQAALSDSFNEAMAYDVLEQTEKERDTALADAKAAREELIHTRRAMESRYDCHAGPGTTQEGCGVCITCLSRKLESSEDSLREAQAKLEKQEQLLSRTNPPPERAYECLHLLDSAGMGMAGSPHGNTLTGMTKEICEVLSAERQAREQAEAHVAAMRQVMLLAREGMKQLAALSNVNLATRDMLVLIGNKLNEAIQTDAGKPLLEQMERMEKALEACANLFNDMDSVAWMDDSDFTGCSYSCVADEVRAALAQTEEPK